MDLDILARKLGLTFDVSIRKAEELMRLTEIRSDCSSLSSLGLTGSCKAVMCLELAAVLCGHHVERATAVRLSGMTKKSYATSIKVLECLLDLQPRTTTIRDLAVQFGCTEAKALATQVLSKYQETQLGHDRADMSTVFFNSVALYAACRKLKMKVDKTKLLAVSGAKRAAFDRLLSQMETFILTLPVSSQATSVICEKDNFPHHMKLESSDVVTITDDRTSDESIEPYEIWKQRILSEARQALLKTLPKSPRHVHDK